MDQLKENLQCYTIAECEDIFTKLIEPNIEQYKESKDKLSILRTCLEILNILEDSPNHRTAGRILVFLAKILNAFDQSGLNPRSESRSYSLPEQITRNFRRLETNPDLEEGETRSDDESNESPKEIYYERFWKLQELLNNPSHLYDRNAFYNFRAYVETIIAKFEETPATFQTWDLKTGYMIDPKALSLQLNDINTRRCLLVQISVVLHHLEMPDNCILDNTQISWISTTWFRIYSLLGEIPNREEGVRFLGLVKVILTHEEMWNRWKTQTKCKTPKTVENVGGEDEEDEDMAYLNIRGTYYKTRKISNELNQAKPYKMTVIGSPDMYRLWNMKDKKLNNDPDLAQYLNIPPEKQAELFKSPNYSYRLFRLLRKSPFFFIPTSAAIQSLDGYLKTIKSNSDSMSVNSAHRQQPSAASDQPS